MVYISQYSIVCNACETLRITDDLPPRGGNGWGVIQKAQEAGWVRFGERDYCPFCWENRDEHEVKSPVL